MVYENEILLADVINKVRDQEWKRLQMDCPNVINQLIEFVTHDSVNDVDALRRAMYCQVQRFKIRKQGLDMIHNLLQKDYVIFSAKYAIMNGYLGLTNMKLIDDPIAHCLDNIQMITPQQKIELLLAQAQITEWCVHFLKMNFFKEFRGELLLKTIIDKICKVDKDNTKG